MKRRRSLNHEDKVARVGAAAERLDDLLNADPDERNAAISPGLRYRRAQQTTQTAAQNKSMTRAIGKIEPLVQKYESYRSNRATTRGDVTTAAEDIRGTVEQVLNLDLEDDVETFLQEEVLERLEEV